LKEPENLKAVLGTPLEALWTTVKQEAETLIKQSEDNLIIQKKMLELAESIIAEEKKKQVKM
tara:strand:+ start:2270 stop:2455 length:186 start_codon:yes stop_codon:yes gene_type:complete